MSVDSVAKASGVHRSTVYRRWRTAPGLVADLAAHIGAEFILPETGTLRDDLVEVAEQLRRQLDADGARLAAALIGWPNPSVRGLLTSFWTARQQNVAEILARHGVSESPALVTRLIAGPIYYQALMEGQVPTRNETEQLVALTIAHLNITP